MKRGRLKQNTKGKREQLDQANADAKTALQLQVEINDIKLANRDIERQINKTWHQSAQTLGRTTTRER